MFARVDVGSLGARVKALSLNEAPAAPAESAPRKPEPCELRTPEQVIADAVAAQKEKETSQAAPGAAASPSPSEGTPDATAPHACHDGDIDTCHELYVQTLKGSDLTDSEFVLEDGSTLRAHRCILSTKGPAFRSALANGGPRGVIHVANTTVGSLRAFVQFLYVGEIAEAAMKAAQWHEVWRLGEQYQVAPLKAYLSQHVDEFSAARAAEVAADASEMSLLDACCSFAAASLPKITEAGLQGVRAGVALNLMVGHDCPVERFKFAARWCRANGKGCGDEDVLSLLRGVELDRLTMPELVEVVRPSGLLSADMLLDVYEQRLKTDAWGDSRFDLVQNLRLYDAGDADSGLRPPAPAGISLFSDGRIVVCDSANGKVQMLSYDGRFIREYGPGAAFEQNHLVQPTSVAVGRRGQVIVTDRATNSVQVFTETGCFLRSFGAMGDGDGQFRGPHTVAINPTRGDLVVTDEFNHRVQVFDVHGNVKRIFGREGDGNGEFRNPTGVAVSKDGNIVVADCGNARIQVFTSDGYFIRSFGSRGEGPARFRSITAVAVAPNGDIVVCDPYSDSRRLQVFSSEGVYLQSIGSFEPDQSRDGSPGEGGSPAPPTIDVGRPKGIAVDHKGKVYVTDANENRVAVFGFPEGSLASREQRGRSPGASLVGLTGAKEAPAK
jgi:DNA-binding beta-propeller fold protein YncE